MLYNEANCSATLCRLEMCVNVCERIHLEHKWNTTIKTQFQILALWIQMSQRFLSYGFPAQSLQRMLLPARVYLLLECTGILVWNVTHIPHDISYSILDSTWHFFLLLLQQMHPWTAWLFKIGTEKVVKSSLILMSKVCSTLTIVELVSLRL